MPSIEAVRPGVQYVHHEPLDHAAGQLTVAGQRVTNHSEIDSTAHEFEPRRALHQSIGNLLPTTLPTLPA